jgi:hypothetical protein
LLSAGLCQRVFPVLAREMTENALHLLRARPRGRRRLPERERLPRKGSGSSPFVVMVTVAHLRHFDHPSLSGPLRPPGLGRVFVERQMGAPLMIISAVRRQRAAERAFAENDDMVQTVLLANSDLIDKLSLDDLLFLFTRGCTEGTPGVPVGHLSKPHRPAM